MLVDLRRESAVLVELLPLPVFLLGDLLLEIKLLGLQLFLDAGLSLLVDLSQLLLVYVILLARNLFVVLHVQVKPGLVLGASVVPLIRMLNLKILHIFFDISVDLAVLLELLVLVERLAVVLSGAQSWSIYEIIGNLRRRLRHEILLIFVGLWVVLIARLLRLVIFLIMALIFGLNWLIFCTTVVRLDEPRHLLVAILVRLDVLLVGHIAVPVEQPLSLPFIISPDDALGVVELLNSFLRFFVVLLRLIVKVK